MCNLIFKRKRNFFLIKNLDSHINIELFYKIKILIKTKNNFKYHKAVNYGLTSEKRDKKIIVSLTSYPLRIKTAVYAINTLLNQTLKPDKVILYLAESEFLNKEEDLPDDLLKLKEIGLEICWCEDLKSYKKLIPALKQYPDDIIVTADDDLYYRQDWLESLYNSYLKNPYCIHARRACAIETKGNTFYISSHYSNKKFEPTFKNQFLTGAGVLFPPNSLNSDVFNIGQIKTLIPTHDDIYFWMMAVLNKTKIKLIENEDVNIYVVQYDDNALSKINNTKGSYSPYISYKKIMEKYPEALEILKNEDC